MGKSTGNDDFSTNPKVAKAYCDGRSASAAGALITTNPNIEDTPEWLAWNRGWRLYVSGGTTTVPDICAVPAKFTKPTLTATKDPEDLSGLTYDLSLSESFPAVFFYGSYDDYSFSETGTDKHTFRKTGSNRVAAVILGSVEIGTSIIVTEYQVSVPPTRAFSSPTSTVAATYTENGDAVADISVAAVSSDTEVFTVSTPVDTDVDGLATFTLTKVGAGTATLTVTAASGPSAVCIVTVT